MSRNFSQLNPPFTRPVGPIHSSGSEVWPDLVLCHLVPLVLWPLFLYCCLQAFHRWQCLHQRTVQFCWMSMRIMWCWNLGNQAMLPLQSKTMDPQSDPTMFPPTLVSFHRFGQSLQPNLLSRIFSLHGARTQRLWFNSPLAPYLQTVVRSTFM